MSRACDGVRRVLAPGWCVAGAWRCVCGIARCWLLIGPPCEAWWGECSGCMYQAWEKRALSRWKLHPRSKTARRPLGCCRGPNQQGLAPNTTTSTHALATPPPPSKAAAKSLPTCQARSSTDHNAAAGPLPVAAGRGRGAEVTSSSSAGDQQARRSPPERGLQPPPARRRCPATRWPHSVCPGVWCVVRVCVCAGLGWAARTHSPGQAVPRQRCATPVQQGADRKSVV